MKFLNKISKQKIKFHVVFWIALYMLAFIAMYRLENAKIAFEFCLVIISPIIIPVYLHSLIFEKLFHRKKYYLYGLLTILIVLVFGYFNTLIFDLFIEDGSTETYLTLIIFMAMFTGFRYLEIGTKQQFKLQREEALRFKAEARQTIAELDLLKSQINPHFLFNTLNSIYALIIEKNDLAGTAVLKLSSLLRYLLDSSKQKSVSLKLECEFIENYIALEEMRLDDRCVIDFQRAGDMSGKSIAPMLLIPFIENAFKHGISAAMDRNFINIKLLIDQTGIVLNVENNIAPSRETKHQTDVKTGLNNVKRRLILLYPNKHELKVSQIESVFKIELQIVL